MENGTDMKNRVARTLKWNTLDKIATQCLYAVTGIILARELTEEEFGLVGAILVFQSFATLFVDSGFSYALLQRKRPTEDDYSTILWFNLGVATLCYIVLALGAPLIADIFENDERIIPLSRVMFLTFILNAAAIVQTNRRIKLMDVKMVTVSNTLGLLAGSVAGIYMALTGWGAWALVWQAVINSGVKTLILWVADTWRPKLVFSFSILRSFFHVGSGVFGTSFLNVLFQNIYSFFIGNRVGLFSLGYYYQADKWSKMGVASLSAIFTQSFLPLLSEYQDNPERYADHEPHKPLRLLHCLSRLRTSDCNGNSHFPRSVRNQMGPVDHSLPALADQGHLHYSRNVISQLRHVARQVATDGCQRDNPRRNSPSRNLHHLALYRPDHPRRYHARSHHFPLGTDHSIGHRMGRDARNRRTHLLEHALAFPERLAPLRRAFVTDRMRALLHEAMARRSVDAADHHDTPWPRRIYRRQQAARFTHTARGPRLHRRTPSPLQPPVEDILTKRLCQKS